MLCINMIDPANAASLNDYCVIREWEYSKESQRIFILLWKRGPWVKLKKKILSGWSLVLVHYKNCYLLNWSIMPFAAHLKIPRESGKPILITFLKVEDEIYGSI